MASDSIGDRIRGLRAANHLTQNALANALGVTDTTIYQWETGARFPTRENQKRLAEVLGVSQSFLVNGRELDGHGDSIPADVLSVYTRLGDRERRTWLRIGHVLREESERYHAMPDSGQVEEDEEQLGTPWEDQAAHSQTQAEIDELRRRRGDEHEGAGDEDTPPA